MWPWFSCVWATLAFSQGPNPDNTSLYIPYTRLRRTTRLRVGHRTWSPDTSTLRDTRLQYDHVAQNIGHKTYSLYHTERNLVSWSSWLWHLLNTQNVPSSILGEIKFLSSSHLNTISWSFWQVGVVVFFPLFFAFPTRSRNLFGGVETNHLILYMCAHYIQPAFSGKFSRSAESMTFPQWLHP